MRASPFVTGVWAFPLATAGLAVLSLYRESLGLQVSYLSLLTLMLIWIIQATSWNILSGFTGYFSFGQAAYVGTGAYATAFLYGRHGVSFYLALLAAGGLCALLALAIGGLAFRLRSLRGEIFALLTLAVPFILGALARTSRAIDGGQGIPLPVPAFPAQIGLFQDFLYLVSLLVAAGAVWAAFATTQRRPGTSGSTTLKHSPRTNIPSIPTAPARYILSCIFKFSAKGTNACETASHYPFPFWSIDGCIRQRRIGTTHHDLRDTYRRPDDPGLSHRGCLF